MCNNSATVHLFGRPNSLVQPKKKPHDFPQQQHALCTRQHSSRHRCLLCFLGVNERCVGSISKTRRVPPTSRQPRHAVKKQSKYEVFIHWFFFPNYKETQISEEKYSSKGERRDLFPLWTFLIAGSPHVPALKTWSGNMSEKVFNNEAAPGELLKYKHVKTGRSGGVGGGRRKPSRAFTPRWDHEKSQTHDGFICTLKRILPSIVCVVCVCVRRSCVVI